MIVLKAAPERSRLEMQLSGRLRRDGKVEVLAGSEAYAAMEAMRASGRAKVAAITYYGSLVEYEEVD